MDTEGERVDGDLFPCPIHRALEAKAVADKSFPDYFHRG